MYAIRITLCSRITGPKIVDFFQEFKCIIFEENILTNHHYHILTEPIGPNIDAFRKRMNRHFLPSKNQSYCKEDKGSYSIYISKEKSKPIYNTLYTEEELQTFRELSYIKPKLKQSTTAKLVDTYTQDEEFCHYHYDQAYQTLADEEDEINHMLDYFITNYNGPFGIKHAQEYIFGVYAKLKPVKLRKLLKNKILY